jgi:cytochrome c peroxidase
MKLLSSPIFWSACLSMLAAGVIGRTVIAEDKRFKPEGPDTIWRSIFARPAAAPTPALEAQRVALGSVLFSDTRLSRDGDRSCASCHQPEKGYSDGLPKARGRDGTSLKRNTPHLYNLALATSLYWDGREPTLEAQARVPLHAPNELAAEPSQLLARISADLNLRRQFSAAFPDETEISEAALLSVLAAYERSLVSPQTAFDAWVAGDDDALSEQEKRGFRIFVGKGGCVACHGGWRMTDDGFHDIGLDTDDPGRSAVPGGAAEIPAFKTPGLRQVARTAPYMHNGSLAALEDVVAHYAGEHVSRPSLAPSLVRDLKLNADERAALVAFLRTL